MNKLAAVMMLCGLIGSAAASETAVVYFSKFENAPISAADSVSAASRAPGQNLGMTAAVAKAIAAKTDANLYSIKTVTPYPSTMQETIDRNHEEQSASALPKLKELPTLNGYKTIYLGFPAWNMSLPKAVESFLTNAKIPVDTEIRVFCTHDGYGCGFGNRAVSAHTQAKVLPEVLQVHSGSSASSYADDLTRWVGEETKKTVTAAADNEIQAKVAGHTVRIRLNNTPEAQQFRKMLPLSVSMGEFGSREYYGPMPKEIQTSSKGQFRFEDGTLTYCPTNNTLAIFYSQSLRPNLTMAVYPMGKVVSDLSIFHQMGHYEKFDFSAPAKE